jgi:DNA adenine methylase
MISTSPLRYPGGKARFTKFIWEAVIASSEKPEIFVEPFCGGAGVSIALLETGKIDRIALNDVDPLISSFWKVVFGKSCRTRDDINWLLNQIEYTNITIQEWKRQKGLVPQNIRESAWKCFFLNRTSFNGIIHKAGPVGGWEQKNRKLDVRFNREKLMVRINELFQLRKQVHRVESRNWQQFCSKFSKQKAYLYLDPPYYHRAEQLYGYLFNRRQHEMMRNHLLDLQLPWMLSYDDAPEVRDLYNELDSVHGRVIDQTYSAHPMGGASFVGRELFFSNRPLPSVRDRAVIMPHVGMTVVGCFREVELTNKSPIRIPFPRLQAIAT